MITDKDISVTVKKDSKLCQITAKLDMVAVFNIAMFELNAVQDQNEYIKTVSKDITLSILYRVYGETRELAAELCKCVMPKLIGDKKFEEIGAKLAKLMNVGDSRFWNNQTDQRD